MRRAEDVLAIDLVRAGVCLRPVRVHPDMRWMFESLSVVARRAIGVAVMRRSHPARRTKRVEV